MNDRTPEASDPELMTVQQAALYLLVSDRTVRKYIDLGVLKAKRLPGGQLRLRREDVRRLAE